MIYDILILGGGPGGYLAAERAAHAGLQVCLFEKRALGGVCLNEGCIPSKTFLNSAKVFEHAKDGSAYGVSSKDAAIDQKAVVARKNSIVQQLVSGVAFQMKKNKVTVIAQNATIQGRDAERNIIVATETEQYVGKKLIIATGSQPIVPPIPGLKEGLAAGEVVTNKEILDLETIPKKLVIIGAGVIGLEMACYFQTVGSQVTVIEMLDHIAGIADREITTALQKSYEKKGIVFKLQCQVTGFKKGSIEYKEKETLHTIPADVTLLSIGRKVNSQGIGIESLHVEMNAGKIVVDAQQRTNIPDVFAVGDVTGQWMLAHAAYREAEVAVNTLLGKKDYMRYEAMPSVIYSTPEVGFVGESEESALEKGIEYKKVVIPMSYSGRYLAETKGEAGMCKILVDVKYDRLIGCHILGSYASEIILVAGMMIEKEMKINEIKEIVFPHPTVGEIIREAVFQL